MHLCLQAILKQHSLKYSFTWCHFFVKFPQLVVGSQSAVVSKFWAKPT